MIVECDNCATKFNLDESSLGEEGTWLRCTRCQNVFQAGGAPAPPAAPEPAPSNDTEDFIQLDLDAGGDSGGREKKAEDMADFGLMSDDGQDMDTGGKKPGGVFKILFWLIGLLIFLAVAGAGALVAIDRLGVAPSLVDPFRGMPGLSMLLGAGGGPDAGGEALSEEIDMALANVRGYYRNNPQAGRLFIIQGIVENHHQGDRVQILVRGRLRDKNGQVARQAVVYAGVVFTPEELKQLDMKSIQARLGAFTGADGSPYVVVPDGAIPFMIVFADLPSNLAEFTAEVVGSQALAGSKPRQ